MVYRTNSDILEAAYLTVRERLVSQAKQLDKHLKRVKNRNKTKKRG
jgi:hypothetical protein